MALKMVRVVFEELSHNPPRRHEREYGLVQTIEEAVLRASALVRKEEIPAGLFEIQHDDGELVGELTVDMLNGGAEYKGVKGRCQ